MTRSFLTLGDLNREELFEIFQKALKLKAAIKARKEIFPLKNKVVGILFEKPSTRTRVSFESAAIRLGGHAIYLSSNDLQLRRGEPVKDTARVLGGYLDALVARVYDHRTVEELAEYSGITVINALSDIAHPTQAVCDLLTILEVKGSLDGLTLAYIGDGNNVCQSLLECCALAGVNIVAACPEGYHPKAHILDNALRIAEKSGSRITVVDDPTEAAKGADILYADVWVSMGEESEKEKKMKAFKGYQINADLLSIAAKGALVMHCLPAYRGLEITDDVIECPQSIVWQQAENKTHGAAAILAFFMDSE
ncbi:Ornithine carbamoyltransferase [uncultured Desulfobacterium sp.]|uniref:Ornithine carbamoyltransferase n=1 Tax=uncultured Desulfobacterium sp. TaxID=201089 RepID=A0A445MUD2_9BACT|nr:Ornithine carbamoyltransferase [uncultured Desulfobacterium sp.]